MFNDKITMLILFRKNVDLSKFKQALFNLFKRDKKVINVVINSLIKDGRVKKVLLDKPSAAVSLIFVV